MMPKYECNDCRKEYWGWGVRYMLRAGKALECPECGGTVLEKGVKGARPAVRKRQPGRRKAA